jgi:hypothetical protein
VQTCTGASPRVARLRRACSRVAVSLAIAAGMVAASAAGCGNAGIVGGDCAVGYTQCALTCVDLQTDPANCGACGHVCPAGVACQDGVCGGIPSDAMLDDGAPWNDANEECDASDPAHPVCYPRPHLDGSKDGTDDGASGDGGTGDGSGGDGTSGDGTTGDGTTGDGSNGDGSGGDGSTGDGGEAGCVPPFDTPQGCGSCTNVCVAPNGVCTPVDGGFQCAPNCNPPLTDCNGQCVNLTSDPQNCGVCGKVCASQYCFMSMCEGSVAGSVMVIGHDFQKTAPGDQQAKLLTNSVFYYPGPVNLLSFEHYGDPATVANGLKLLTKYAKSVAVTFNVQSTSDDTILANDTVLAGATAVIVWDQPNAPAGTLGTLGTNWAPHLTKFAQGGGLVIALDGAQGVAEMPSLITNGALLAVTGHGSVLPGTPAADSSASIARLMTNVYLVEQNTAWFTTSEAMGATTFYVANVQGQPLQLLAVQKVIN